LNYVANAGESINTGFWMDAKAYMGRAVESADETLANVSLADPKMLYDLDILRSETRRDYEELLKASFRLKLPEDILNQILAVQEELIGILRRLTNEGNHKDAEVLLFLADRLTIAEKLLLQERPDLRNAAESVTQAINNIEKQIPTFQDETIRRRNERTLQELKEIQEGLETHLTES
jgi:cell division protein ZapA (FtsZ GTPase activity inhibitor)